MKLKIGDKVKFTFLGEPGIGTIEEIESLPYGVDTSLRYSVNDGKYIYPTKIENIKEKL